MGDRAPAISVKPLRDADRSRAPVVGATAGAEGCDRGAHGGVCARDAGPGPAPPGDEPRADRRCRRAEWDAGHQHQPERPAGCALSHRTRTHEGRVSQQHARVCLFLKPVQRSGARGGRHNRWGHRAACRQAASGARGRTGRGNARRPPAVGPGVRASGCSASSRSSACSDSARRSEDAAPRSGALRNRTAARTSVSARGGPRASDRAGS